MWPPNPYQDDRQDGGNVIPQRMPARQGQPPDRLQRAADDTRLGSVIQHRQQHLQAMKTSTQAKAWSMYAGRGFRVKFGRQVSSQSLLCGAINSA